MEQNRRTTFERHRIKKCTLHVNPAFPFELIDEAVEAAGFDGQRGPFERMPASKQARVIRGRLAFQGRAFTLYVKEYLDRSPWEGLKRLVRAGRAKRAAAGAMILEQAGLGTPAVAAWGQQGRSSEGFILTVGLPGARSLWRYLAGDAGPLTPSQRHRLARELGRSVGRMHAAGIRHGDLRIGNILLRHEDENWGFYFIDNERTRAFRRLPRKVRLKNLVQLNLLPDNVTRADRLRFWREYVRIDGSIGSDTETLRRDVLAATDRRRGRTEPR